MPNYNNVPLMFRSQLEGRCQIQRLVPKTKVQDAEKWADQWVEKLPEKDYQFSQKVHTKTYEFTWRFITNSGQDEGVIRPVIGALGFPYFPGSSMKGAFWRTCPKEKRSLYCGYEENNESHPGILRFHGGYPDKNWMFEELVDVVHPQEDWQLGINDGRHSAFIQISLYQPKFTFGITSNKELTKEEWQEIWQIWEGAIAQGLGTRVSAGYGQVKLTNRNQLNSLLTVNLKGEGLASQLINKKGEFRANMFKASLRGHTLRLLGGVTDAKTAERITQKLWGGFAGRNGAIVGELGIVFDPIDLEVYDFTYTPASRDVDMPVYELFEGKLDILAMGNIPSNRRKNLQRFVKKLLQFSLLLGGFGKSWRRIDHDVFYSKYLDSGKKPMIGCHWQLLEESQDLSIPINNLNDVTEFLNSVQSNLKNWVKYNQGELDANGANWRESFKQGNVQVWGRIAENKNDSRGIRFFHGNYQGDKTIKQSNLTGRMGRIGRIWHRMYPQNNGKFIELLTIFPDNSPTTKEFLQYLGSKASDFTKVW